jgi:hypothetical protein
MAPLLIDTNLLCLLLVGNVGTDRIAKHKRLAKYDVIDYDRVRSIALRSGQLVLCPHVLAETSNISRQTPEPLRSLIGAALQDIANASLELQIPARTAATAPEYLRLGLTDAVLLELGKFGRTLLSDDFDLCHAAAARGYSVINYNYLRDGMTLDQIGAF